MRRWGLFFLFAACASSSGKASLDIDGAWVRTFQTDRDEAFHAAMSVLMQDGYSVMRADPMGGSFTAQSPVRNSAWPGQVAYTLAFVVVEPAPEQGMRIRLTLTDTHERRGGGRKPNNDRAVKDRADYEAIFDKIERVLG